MRAALFVRRSLFVVGGGILFLLLSSLVIDDSFYINPDSARYLIWAKSFASLEGFKDDTTPFPEYYLPHAPLYSVVLAPFVALFPDDVLAAKWGTAFMGLSFVVLFFTWMSGWVGRTIAGFAALVLLLHPLVVVFGTQILSDVPFLLLTVLVIYRIEPARDVGLREKEFILLVALLVASVLLREVGWILVATVALTLLLRRRMLEAAVLVLAPMVATGVWYYRNEILVAPLERPSLHKLSAISSHFYSMPEASLAAELWARAASNFSAYGEMVFTLLFVPGTMNTIIPVNGLYATLGVLLPWITWVMVAIPVGLFLAGIIAGFRLSVVKFQLLFSLLYLMVLLIYPFVDVRLAMVLLVPFVSLCAVGFRSLWVRFSRLGKTFAAVVMVVCLIPNAAWVSSYVSMKQGSSVLAREKISPLPALPYREVGAWISTHLPERIVLASWRKEMALWIGGRKLVHLQLTIRQDEFSALLRDEQIEYIISVVDASGLRDVEASMAMCATHSFRTIARMGDLEVIQVVRNDLFFDNEGIIESHEQATREGFRNSLRLLHELKPVEAAQGFQNLLRLYPHNALLNLYYAISVGMSGQVNEAQMIFARLKQFSQTSAMISQVYYHQQLLERARRLNVLPSGVDRARECLSVAFDYWYVGFRNVALHYVRQAVRQDSSFAPAYEAAAYLFVVQRDTATARWAFEQLAGRNPQSFFVPSLQELFASLQSLNRSVDPTLRVRLRTTIARCYLQFALVEEAVGELHEGLKENPTSIELLELLANLYLVERRSAPALRTFERLAAIDPQRSSAQHKLDALRARL
jgi:tetratricopeptide (TPR) repeat protein